MSRLVFVFSIKRRRACWVLKPFLKPQIWRNFSGHKTGYLLKQESFEHYNRFAYGLKFILYEIFLIHEISNTGVILITKYDLINGVHKRNITCKTLFKSLKKIINENPYTTLFTGDFNAHSLNWWPQGDSTQDGILLDNLFSHLILYRSCIDLIISDQSNLGLNIGVRPSIDLTCKHQITFCKINFAIPPPPAYNRKVWQFNKANSSSISSAIYQFPWHERLTKISNPFFK